MFAISITPAQDAVYLNILPGETSGFGNNVFDRRTKSAEEDRKSTKRDKASGAQPTDRPGDRILGPLKMFKTE